MSIKVIDNFLPRKEHLHWQHLLTHSDFSWYLSGEKNTVQQTQARKKRKEHKNINEYIQFTHMFYFKDNKVNKINSNYFPLIENLCKHFIKKRKLKELHILRAKANLQPRIQNAKKHEHNTPHVDFLDDHMVLLYYVNNSDGDTHFFKGKKIIKSVSPKANRLVVFDGNLLHTGSHPIKSIYRIVLNIDCLF